MSRPRLPAVAISSIGTVLAACSPPPPGAPEDPCPEVPGSVRDFASAWVFALCERVNPDHVPAPRNDAEDVVFRHVYEGLVDVDCRGELVPALATAWASEDDARSWTFELQEGRTFVDGEPVTAAAVREAWSRTRVRSREHSHRRWLWTDVRPFDMDADGRVLTIRLPRGDPDFPFRLAEPEFFVTRPTGAAWPLGTRDRVPVSRRLPGGGLEISLVTTRPRHGRGSGVRFRVQPDADPRDAFGEDVHALLTRDRVALGFLAEQGDARLLPLPWSRRYTLVDPTGSFTWLVDALPLLRSELEREVLPGVARAPWDPVQPEGTPPAHTDSFVIRFARRDRDAAAAAERVAALASRRGDGRRWVVQAVSPLSVHDGGDPAVVALPRRWFDPPPARRARSPFPVHGATYPLAETRAVLVTRPEIGGIRIGWDGVPRLDVAGWTTRAQRALP